MQWSSADGSLWPSHTGRIDRRRSHGSSATGNELIIPKAPQPWATSETSHACESPPGRLCRGSLEQWHRCVPPLPQSPEASSASGNEISLAVRACLLREIPTVVFHGKRILPKTCVAESTVGSLRTPAAPPTTGTPSQVPFVAMSMRTVVSVRIVRSSDP